MDASEYLTSNTLIAYPFKQDQGVPDNICRLFADACVHTDESVVKISSISYLVSTGNFSFTALGEKHVVNVYNTGNEQYFTINSGKSCFVINAELLRSSVEFVDGGIYELEESCIVRDYEGVTSIMVYNHSNLEGKPNFVLSGDVAFYAGYNSEIVANNDNEVEVDFQPGSGLGTVPCQTSCDEDLDTDGHSLPSDDGHVVIAGDGCYEITQTDSKIQIHGKCVACCQCQQFVDVVGGLKEVAKRVKSSKDKAEKNTGLYFESMRHFALHSEPLFDVQVGISTDAGVAEMAYSGSNVRNTSDYNNIRVTCTVTNMCGVPAIITVPDLWAKYRYGRSGVLYISGYDYKRGLIDTYDRLLKNGIKLSINNGPSSLTSTTIDVKNKFGNQGGWLVFSNVRGPLINRTGHNAKYMATYERVNLLSNDDWLSKVKSSEAWDTISDMVSKDLSNGINESGFTKRADEITDAVMIRGADSSGWAGFKMPAGYSFTITNVYTVPSGMINKNTSITAMFYSYVYVPACMYVRAHNLAKKEATVSKDADGNTHVAWQWKLPTESWIHDSSRVANPLWAGVYYDYMRDKTYTYNVENGLVNKK